MKILEIVFTSLDILVHKLINRIFACVHVIVEIEKWISYLFNLSE